MRQLATIQRIAKLEPIPGADAIEKATVLGWELVVKKGEFKEGDLAVYCEIDSILPDRPEFEFLKSRGFRIKTVRLRGQISQGICFPLSIIPVSLNSEPKEGIDVTEAIGVTKYEPAIPACLAGKVKGTFPSFIPKTDETRVQVLQKLLDKYQGVHCYVTEKIDGSSATFYLKDDVFGVCSRNMDLLEDESNSFWKAARAMNIEEKMRSIGGNFAIQGELYGEGIQGNKYGIKGQTVRFFNHFDIDKFAYSEYGQLLGTFAILDLPLVPILNPFFELTNSIHELVEMATIKSSINPNQWAEGIVIRPVEERLDLLLSRENFNNGRVSFKVINPEFLLKHGE